MTRVVRVDVLGSDTVRIHGLAPEQVVAALRADAALPVVVEDERREPSHSR